ncbi:type III-B CRISPR module RAMP protein Cmr6 [Methylacidiphilum kamchatkense]|uniref:CRISPR type III-B/RAMP module RAMP protein Cmr6 n=1 Tax=Methylacidiphilum kamchatkense Kam1 TaxID=1202785 RepID=A0A516TMR2_9BACT|nr:type III-B CRISPR module RAMP protein Cmr6 [Methylacidiphilum kamchatkense]QDQ42529.1 CRISPR type III-B/RAMP module RAMP protein Cmr6 [Methylacidiphilum kamchatkense Kam1]
MNTQLLLIEEVKNALSTEIESRSLFLEKYFNPKLTKDDRKRQFIKAFKIKNNQLMEKKLFSWWEFCNQLPQVSLIYAQLRSRLMVNMAGGVLENAGLCLDRFGIPYIPGSAVKGCARRMAIEKLLEATDDEKPTLLSEIALVFGWTSSDWEEKHKDSSDFYYGCHSQLSLVRKAAEILLETFSIPTRNSDTLEQLLENIPNYAGTVRFLAAYPIPTEFYPTAEKPKQTGDLELDVIACHHQKYYAQDQEYSKAWDTEDPIPVFFPAISPFHIFVFCLQSSQRASEKAKKLAESWLQEGLETLGIGAKTAAGYGWYQICTSQVEKKIQEKKEEEKQKEAAKREEEEKKKEKKKRKKEKKKRKKEKKKRKKQN